MAAYEEMIFTFVRPAQEYTINTVIFTIEAETDCKLYIGIGTGYDWVTKLADPELVELKANTPVTLAYEINFQPNMLNDLEHRKFSIWNSSDDRTNEDTFLTKWTIKNLDFSVTKNEQ